MIKVIDKINLVQKDIKFVRINFLYQNKPLIFLKQIITLFYYKQTDINKIRNYLNKVEYVIK